MLSNTFFYVSGKLQSLSAWLREYLTTRSKLRSNIWRHLLQLALSTLPGLLMHIFSSSLFSVDTNKRSQCSCYRLFNDALNTFYLRLHGVRRMIKDHSDSGRGNPLPPHGLLFPISSKDSFICIIPQKE